MDEALLTGLTEAVLRVYRWERPAFSFGYFLPWREAAAAAGEGRSLVRRWTGGGMVAHGEDFTWSLILPSNEPESRRRPAESYGLLHAALAEAFRRAGAEVEKVKTTARAPAGGLCFTAPAPGDLMLGGRKVAGAGQRRCRHGLLHQGSVSGVTLPGDFPVMLAHALAEEVQTFPPEQLPGEVVRRLVHERYGNEAWLQKR
ncbi:MAG TPA: hypothetical protein VG796_28600 [Verrucomicrobiales bacterium]|nr:hypothetical protein [Verrucomicrobiales bacterium]